MTPRTDVENPSEPDENSGINTPKLDELDVDQLGRQRPDCFPNLLFEVLFCSSLLISMFMAEFFISGFNIILPNVSHALDIPKESQTWPASVFSLVTGSFLLPFGRLADIHGAYIVFNFGLVWFSIWALISGFSTNYQMLIVARALGGFGPAAFLPTSIMLLGKTYRPGPRKNLVFSLWSAFAPIGFFLGIITGGATAEYMSWRWYFYFGSIILFIVCIASFITIPRDWASTHVENAHIKMDWWGAVTIVPGLILTTFAITEGAHAPQGWKTPYIIVTFVLGVLLLAAAVYIEGWVAEQPLLPFDLFKPKYMGRMSIALFFAYGIFGIFLFYASFHIGEWMGASALKTAVWFAPMAAGGIILATVGGFTLHLLPGKVLIMISSCGFLACTLLFALAPIDANYWAFIFPAMVGSTIGVDTAFIVSNVFITSNVARERQGIAGALISSLLFVGISFFLGLADLAVSENEKRGGTEGHKVAFWFATACAAIVMILFATINPGKAESELTMEERLKLENGGGSSEKKDTEKGQQAEPAVSA
ncbi:major facilitator superfamily domain-containing protein [Staphylotrichum tortipilum]|uniref:Major facilitator superfamily domain-containing protein n=1 Tax=Staphylotrichum tortipilum TaxID=2831512 RepID=A0AAN6MRR6_9PEZI|nr:major facilitator superfamily domain-containing protein [Staphylotrichum longicolle]